MKTKLLAILAAAMTAAPIAADAIPVQVAYNVSGTAGAWKLDFSVTNEIPSTSSQMVIYFFGVSLPARNIGASPGGWDPDEWTTWNNSGFGGSSKSYNNNWIELSFTAPPAIGFGTTLSGFEALVKSTDAPASVDWFAFGTGGVYEGSDNFNTRNNPGFEGTAFAATAGVPEPGTIALLGIAVAGLGLSRRRNLN